MTQDPAKPRAPESAAPNLLAIIMTIVAAWGGVLALGAFLFTRDQWGVWRALIILACVGTFLGSWGLLMWYRHARPKEPLSPGVAGKNPLPPAEQPPPAEQSPTKT